MTKHTLGSLDQDIRANGGLLTINMEDLRDTFGAQRLGKHVRENITETLKRQGISHYPDPLPNSQLAFIRLFRTDSQVGELMRAIEHPDPNTDQFVLQSIKKRPGRSAADEAENDAMTREAATDEAPKRKRGRPKGSKNKPKVAA